MKIIYFSLDYTPHDQRFLTALAGSTHEVHYVRLQRGKGATVRRHGAARPARNQCQRLSHGGVSVRAWARAGWSVLPEAVRGHCVQT